MTDYLDFYRRHLPTLSGSGSQRSAKCRFHGDGQASLSVNVETGLWNCHAGCGGGTAYQFAKRLGVEAPPNGSSGKSIVRLLTVATLALHKALPESFLQSLGVVQFGPVVRISYRNMDGTDAPRHRVRTDVSAKKGSRWTKGEGAILPYGLWKLEDAAKEGYLVISEGESDCWTLWHHGFPALGIPGAKMADKLNVEHVAQVERIYVIREPDSGGAAFIVGVAKRLLALRWRGRLFELRMPNGIKDPNDLHKQDPEKFKEEFQKAVDSARPLADSPLGGPSQVPEEDGEGEHLTDLGNARRLVRLKGRDLRYVGPWKKWLLWNGIRWVLDVGVEVLRTFDAVLKELLDIEAGQRKAMALRIALLGDGGIMEVLSSGKPEDLERAAKSQHLVGQADDILRWERKSEDRRHVEAAVALARSRPEVAIGPESLDKDPWLLNVENGTLDLRTGELRAARREDLITKWCPTDYDPLAKAPTFEAFLARILRCNQALIGYVRRVFGYALTGDVREDALFIFYGTGANGKTTLLNAIRDAIGPDYAREAPPELLLAKRGESHPTDQADLFGRRVVTTVEMESGRRLAEVLVKRLTGRDPITARRMREDFWTFNPTHKIVLAANHKPIIQGTDRAIWRRIRLIPFTVTIPKDEQDRALGEKLREERKGILAWAVRGCLEWQAQGLADPPEVMAATEGYRQEMDILGDFLAEYCVTGPAYRARASELYAKYLEWHARVEGGEPVTQKAFGTALKQRDFVQDRGTGGTRWWVGLGLKPTEEREPGQEG